MTESEVTETEKRKGWVFRGTHGSDNPTDLVIAKGFKYIVIRRAWLWAFLFVIAMCGFGLYGLHRTQTELQTFEKHAAMIQYNQDLATCNSGNESRATILDLVRSSNVSTQAVKEDPSFGEGFNNLLRQAKAKQADNAAKAEITLAQRNCNDLIKKP